MNVVYLSRMLSRAALILALLVPLAARAGAALDPLSQDLLTKSGYELKNDGTVWDAIKGTPVPAEELPYLISRLAGARRLKALIELNMILNKSGNGKTLAPDDREKVRRLARDNWAVFSLGTRRDLRSYFTPEELASLDQIPVRFEKEGIEPLTDPAPAPVTANPPPTPPAVVPAPTMSTAAVPTPAPVVPTVTAPVPAVPAVSSAPAAALALKPKPELGTLKLWTPPPAPPAPPPSAAPAAAAAPALKPAAVAAPTVSAPAPAAPAAVSAPPPPASVSEAEYAKFVAAGPYATQDRALLELIGREAPEFCLPLLRRTVVNGVPQIALDGTRTGASLRAGKEEGSGPLVIALSPGPLSIERSKGFFGHQRIVLPESPKAWAALGLSPPAFPDAARGVYSDKEQAGELLEQLLLEGLRREGLDASPYAARRWARTAKYLFWERLRQESGRDDFLDPDRRAQVEEWRDRPGESADVSVAEWSSASVWALDPRRGGPEAERLMESRPAGSCARQALENGLVEAARRRAARVGALEVLADAKVIPADQARAAAQAATDEEAAKKRRLLAAPACPAAEPARAAALERSAALLAEAARAERAWREQIAQGADHAR